MIARHSTLAHAAYHDLLRSLQDEAVSDLRGTPTRVERRGRIYWYDTYRVGSDVRKAYIGEDSEALRERLDSLAALKADREARRRARTRLIRILRAEGFMGVDAGTGSLLAALAGAGVFRLGGTIVGTHAFRLYEGELGLRYGLDEAAQTDDLDIASFERLSLALADTVSEPLQRVLGDFAFEPAPSLERAKAWRWRQTRNDLLVEFLTPSFSDTEELRPLAALGVHAQSLHYLNYLIAEPILAAVPYRSGVMVQIPRPERYAVHKLIVADRRAGRDALKARKDLLQAAFLIRALAEDRPDDLTEAYADARAAGPRWRDRLDASLARLPETRTILEGVAR
ncbi:nucleotidyltransferase family protein [Segnochrobactrum spirostomi]|uniref:Nucleotidyltransferase n=1 Tax=Segnochrobactrum spirostomi TaxID=2608987 RepID=A0A6A7Y7I5_9HYPH|nr:GSU2403 family nucleotidyltransferase fold protein [Segnochrobactrum spirostomi]MQT14665.1 hypothetical protein [Segnochrobactrum spirostomi]